MSKRLKVKPWNRYGILTIIKEVECHIDISWRKYRKFLCKCDCWNEKEIRLQCLRNWHTKSCWCYNIKKLQERATHWVSQARIYRIWIWIQQRCYNKNRKEYKHYGERGIICEWKSFEEFYKDMLSTYKEWLEIDRINNDWNYSKDNCRWITRTENLRNTRKNVYYKWKTIGEWSEITEIKYVTIYRRIKRWLTIEEALEFKKTE